MNYNQILSQYQFINQKFLSRFAKKKRKWKKISYSQFLNQGFLHVIESYSINCLRVISKKSTEKHTLYLFVSNFLLVIRYLRKSKH